MDRTRIILSIQNNTEQKTRLAHSQQYDMHTHIYIFIYTTTTILFEYEELLQFAFVSIGGGCRCSLLHHTHTDAAIVDHTVTWHLLGGVFVVMLFVGACVLLMILICGETTGVNGEKKYVCVCETNGTVCVVAVV